MSQHSAQPPTAAGPSAGSEAAAPEAAGLYIHVPFCSAVCPYCDFAVTVGKPAARDDFVAVLLAEMALWQDWPHPIDTIYLGGGTPSLLTPDALRTMLDAASRHLPLTARPRLHLEANPEDVNSASVAAWRALGVDFLSLGVQSFDDRALKRLGRRHTGTDARRAIRLCLEAGFHTLSVDLMFGLPDETEHDLDGSLNALAELAPQHTSCYQLTVHEDTPFGRWRTRGRLVELDEDSQGALYARVHERLTGAGLMAYEVSNFARGPAHRSAHNQKYWRHLPYLGLGPSAHSFDGAQRWWNTRTLTPYAQAVRQGKRPVAGSEHLDTGTLALEALMLGLRTVDGIDGAAFKQRFDIDLAATNAAAIGRLCELGFLTAHDDKLCPTPRGLAVADWLAMQIHLTES